jgi:hypothetical protein
METACLMARVESLVQEQKHIALNVRNWFIRDDAILFVAHVVDARSAIRTLRCLIRLAG